MAVLTNFRDAGATSAQAAGSARSRGAMVNAWLTLAPESTETIEGFVERLCNEDEGLKGVGGFSLVCGQLKPPAPPSPGTGKLNHLAVVSNRTPHAQAATWIAGETGETHGLSNSAYDDPWPKVELGKRLLGEAIEASVAAAEDEQALIERLLVLLSTDSLPASSTREAFEAFSTRLRHSIFIPPLVGDADGVQVARDAGLVQAADDAARPVYGTQKQSVVLLDHRQHVTLVERTLFDDEARAIRAGQGDRRFDFELQPA